MRRTFFAAGTLAAALGLSSCNGDLFSGGQQAQEEFFFEVDAAGNVTRFLQHSNWETKVR